MRPIRVDFAADGTYRINHILFGHSWARGRNAGEGRCSQVGEADRLCPSVDHRPGPQRAARALKRAGVGVIFEEKASGTKRDGRTELQKVLSILGNGDALVVTRLDRLGRSLRDLANIANEIEQAGAHLKVLEQSVDTSSAAGRAFFGMLATFAAFETDVRRIPAGSGGIGTFAIQLAKYLGATVGTTTSTANVDLVRSLGANEVVDYKKQEFEEVPRDYDAVLGTVRGDALEKSLWILKPKSTVVSLIGPPDAAFARARGMNFFMVGVFGLLSRKIIRRAKKSGVAYSFLFVQPNGSQLAEIGELLKSGRIRPVIDRTFPFELAKEALAYLEQGRARGKVVVQMR